MTASATPENYTTLTDVTGSDKHDAPADIAAWIAAAAPEGTAGAVDRISPSAPFDAAEEAAIARAVPRRRAEFATGRRLAREALARLGCLAASLPPDSAGMPQWPTGFVGTISHSGQLCVAVVGRAHNLLGIGIDVEEIGPMQPGLASMICRPDENDMGGILRACRPDAIALRREGGLLQSLFPRHARLSRLSRRTGGDRWGKRLLRGTPYGAEQALPLRIEGFRRPLRYAHWLRSGRDLDRPVITGAAWRRHVPRMESAPRFSRPAGRLLTPRRARCSPACRRKSGTRDHIDGL